MKIYFHFENQTRDGKPLPDFTVRIDTDKFEKELTVSTICQIFAQKYNRKNPISPTKGTLSPSSLLLFDEREREIRDEELRESVSDGQDLFLRERKGGEERGEREREREKEREKSLVCHQYGCGERYDPYQNHSKACRYHPLPPIFHDGLKGWSCCEKRVSSFDDFLGLPGCTWGFHSDEEKETIKIQETGPSSGNHMCSAQMDSLSSMQATLPPTKKREEKKEKPESEQEEEKKDPLEIEDDLSIEIEPGKCCLHRGCEEKYVDASTRETRCIYHPGTPLFHEGLKGWTCCRKRVIDFNDFLNIQGCKFGVHKFVPPPEPKSVQCRHDFYESAVTVNLTIYAKKVIKEKSKINFSTNQIDVFLSLEGDVVFQKTFQLVRPIDPEKSKTTFLSTRVDLTLAKEEKGLEWGVLEKP